MGDEEQHQLLNFFSYNINQGILASDTSLNMAGAAKRVATSCGHLSNGVGCTHETAADK
jgi:hypothetical protein